MKLKISILALAACIVALPASAQQNQGTVSAQKSQTIEELYLSQNIELQMVRNQALSNDWELRSLALQTLRSMAGDGRITEENPGAFPILENLAKRERGPNTKNFNLIRREACNILGEIGGERSQRILLDVLMDDNEPMVLAEAVYGLGRIGSDRNGEVFNKLMWILQKENRKPAPDNNFAFSTLLTIEKIGKSENGIKNPETLNVLIDVLESNYIRDVKMKALDVIYKIRS